MPVGIFLLNHKHIYIVHFYFKTSYKATSFISAGIFQSTGIFLNFFMQIQAIFNLNLDFSNLVAWKGPSVKELIF